MSLSRKKRKDRIKKAERSQSFSLDSTIPTSPSNSTTNRSQHLQSTVYPALLSKVAYAFKENMVVGTKTNNSIKYHEVFDGKDAVVNDF
jgi:hypothetical protein